MGFKSYILIALLDSIEMVMPPTIFHELCDSWSLFAWKLPALWNCSSISLCVAWVSSELSTGNQFYVNLVLPMSAVHECCVCSLGWQRSEIWMLIHYAGDILPCCTANVDTNYFGALFYVFNDVCTHTIVHIYNFNTFGQVIWRSSQFDLELHVS